MPARVARRLGIQPPREHGREVAQRCQQHVVEALHARRLEREVGGLVSGVLVAHTPLGLGEINRRAGHLEPAICAAEDGDRAAQSLERLGVATLKEVREPVPAVHDWTEEAAAVRYRITVDATKCGKSRGRIPIEPEPQARLLDGREQLPGARGALARQPASACECLERLLATTGKVRLSTGPPGSSGSGGGASVARIDTHVRSAS